MREVERAALWKHFMYNNLTPKCSKVHRYKQLKGVLHHRSTFIILSLWDLNDGRKDVFWLMFSVSDAANILSFERLIFSEVCYLMWENFDE